MKKYGLFTGFLFFFLISTVLSQNPILVWSDEFSFNGLPDSSKWNYEETAPYKNNEKQSCLRENLNNTRVENGCLVIEAWKESALGANYSSGSLITLNKHHFLYGRIEIRAMVPTGKGTWPAIWLLGTNIDKVG